jgi:hypothetical protein
MDILNNNHLNGRMNILTNLNINLKKSRILTGMILIFFLIIIASSCEKYIDMEIPDKGRKISANCFFTDTGTVVVFLHKSRFILDTYSEFHSINGAAVILYENGIPVSTLFEEETGKYVSQDFLPSAGASYTLKVIKDSEEITASSYVPHAVPFVLVDTLRVMSEYSENLRFRIRINDPSETDDFYVVTFDHNNDDDHFSYWGNSLIMTTIDPFVSYNWILMGAVFTDDLFSGQSQIVSFDLDLYNFHRDTTDVVIRLWSISRDMYMYISTYQAQDNASNNPFTEPVMVYNNIENGYGIFAGYSTFTDSIKIPQYTEGYEIE